jgi:hypothetical protein
VPVLVDRRLTTGHARAVRAGFVGTFTTALGVGAHEAAGGMAPSATAFAGLALGVGVLSWLLSGRRWTPRTLLAAFLLAQGAVHVSAMVEQPTVHGDGTAMLLTHGLAAALLVAVVPRAEATLLSLLDHLALRALRLLRVVAPGVRSASPADPATSLHGVTLLALPFGRAPPASA